MKKIKLTEAQLKKLQQKLQEDYNIKILNEQPAPPVKPTTPSDKSTAPMGKTTPLPVPKPPSKNMQQINKTFPVPPAPPPTPQKKEETKKGPNVDSPELLADKENFKSYFPGKNIETFRVPLYKYIYANKNNPQLSSKLLKLLYKS